MRRVVGLLASGTDDELLKFAIAVSFVANGFEKREQTSLYAAMRSDLPGIKAVARKLGITLQEIVSAGDAETYRTLVRGEHPGWKKREAASA